MKNTEQGGNFIKYIKRKEANLKPAFIPFCILFINIICFRVFYGSAMIFSDFSREVYIPAAMQSGDVLYKDILNVYAPLGYQINSFLISVFGENLRTFYFAGFINSSFILFALYLILRLFIKKRAVFCFGIIIFITFSCVYAVSQTNYITPYSYSLVLALNGFLWALLSLLYFIKSDKKVFLYSSFLFSGLSISCKYEFIPFIFILFAVIIYKRTDIKTIFLSICLFLSIPLLSAADLYAKGLTLYDLKESLYCMFMLSKAKSVNILYTYLGFIPSISSIKVLLIYFFKTLSYITVIMLLYIAVKRLNSAAKINLILYIIPGIAFLCLIFHLINTFIISNAFYFNWIGAFAIILYMIFCIKVINKHKKGLINIKDKLFFVLFTSTILCSFKCIFNISFNSYGTYYFPLLLICTLLYFYNYSAIYPRKKGLTAFHILIIVIYVFASAYSLSNLQRFKAVYGFGTVKTDKGLVRPGTEKINALYETINYIKSNTNKDDKVLVLPEGAIINFLTDRKSDNKYYYLIPSNIEIFGEDKIVKDLENNLPEYLIIQPMSYNNFKETYFCESFGTKICALIPKYYTSPVVFGDEEFWLAIYKRKNIYEKHV